MSNRIESAMPVPSAVADKMDPSDESSLMDTAREQLKSGAQTVHNQIMERPGTCLAVAAVAGLALGWMLKRK